MWKENPKPIKDYCYPVTSSLFPSRLLRESIPRGSSCVTIKKKSYFHFFMFFLFIFFSSLVQIIIQNLTTYSVYTVNVQAASLSAINPRRVLLGSHSTSRKVNVLFFCLLVPSHWVALILIFLLLCFCYVVWSLQGSVYCAPRLPPTA